MICDLLWMDTSFAVEVVPPGPRTIIELGYLSIVGRYLIGLQQIAEFYAGQTHHLPVVAGHDERRRQLNDMITKHVRKFVSADLERRWKVALSDDELRIEADIRIVPMDVGLRAVIRYPLTSRGDDA